MRRALLRPLSARAVRRSAALVLSATATAAAALGGTTPAAAAGPVTQYGKVVHVADGDTFDVDVQGDGTRTPVRVRMNGLNTMELTEYSYNPANWRGECHGVEAAKRLHALIQGKTVKLTAQNADSMAGSRYRRTPWVSIDGAWRDVSQIMLSEGHGLFLSNKTEYARNRQHAEAAQYAASKGRNLWDRDHCGVGPAQSADLRVKVQWDAPGDDDLNPNGEYIKVVNASSFDVSLAGWRVRDSAPRGYKQRGYVFPAGAKVKAGSAVYVHPGSWFNTVFYFNWA